MAKRKEMYLKTVGGSDRQISSNTFTFQNKIPKFIHDESCCGQIKPYVRKLLSLSTSSGETLKTY